ncbi:hypothetical protein CCR95_08625 [Thiocystis minor]|uniref:hypothetical protein n=1 Tax=Thiocystis minor TaxID=61597 RepID=UPI0019140E53|nr:hypothetical protein [Thiocystis minor]MBK5964146.1 hypothetical protein [Thiocystis minor]
MIKSLLRNAKDFARLLFLSQKKSIPVGHRQYLVKGAYANSLVKFVSKSRQYEPELNLLIKTILRLRKGTFIDVGANVGQTFLKFLEIDEKRHYIGFEPQLHGCLAIDDFIQNNGLISSTLSLCIQAY